MAKRAIYPWDTLIEDGDSFIADKYATKPITPYMRANLSNMAIIRYGYKVTVIKNSDGKTVVTRVE